jgi:hypothetical protein
MSLYKDSDVDILDGKIDEITKKADTLRMEKVEPTRKEIDDMVNIIKDYNLSFFYTLTYGGKNDIYKFNNKNIWGNCKTIKHCVFSTNAPESDNYISISEMLNVTQHTNIPVIPYIVKMPNCDENLRSVLNIPVDAVVFGRHGGETEFNIPITYEAIKKYLEMNENVYFLFMNTTKFYHHPRIIYLNMNIDLIYKVKFINTCDAMIHARQMGETFGCAVAEFAIKNKPVITCRCGDLEHVHILKDKAIIYNSTETLIEIFKNIKTIIKTKPDWYGYTQFTPERVMPLFKNIFDKY